MIKTISAITALFVAFQFAPSGAQGQYQPPVVICCPGDNSSIVSWHEPNSWNPNTVPNSGLNATIEGGTASISSPGAAANQVWIGVGALSSQGGLRITRLGPQFEPGTLTSNLAVIGGDADQGIFGAATVTGLATQWTNTGDFYVGYKSLETSSLTIQGGGAVSSGRGLIGDFVGAKGLATVDGAFIPFFSSGATWDSGSELRVGNGGIGTLNVTNGGVVTNSSGTIGYHPTSTGTVTVAGSGSRWNNTSQLIVGRQSTATSRLNIQSGGVVSNPFAIIADFEHSSGEVNVSGNGSTWNTSELWVGNYGAGDLNVFNDGDVTSTVGRIGVQSTSNGTVRVGGTGSTWQVTSNLFVGGGGNGSLSLSNGGVVSAPLGVSIAGNGSVHGNGTIDTNNVVNSGFITPGPPVTPGLSASTINIDGNYIQTSSATLHVDLDTGDHGHLGVIGDVTLAGTIDVDWIIGVPFWQPSPGQSFTLLSWTGTRSGTFTTVNLPDPNLGIAWSLQYVSNAVLLRAGTSGLPGDFNGDGKVDAADYVGWRKNETANGALPNDNGLTTQADRFNLWRSNFGNMSGSGSGATASSNRVPEPASALTMIFGVAIVFWRVRQLRR